MKIDTRGLNVLLREYGDLSNKVKHTPADKIRVAYLQTGIAAIKAGASLQEYETGEYDERSRVLGLPDFKSTANPFITREQEKEIRGWKSFVHGERRDMVEGAPMIDHIGTYSSLGNFVPTGFYPELFKALGQHDALFNEEDCTVIKTVNGRVMTVPTAGDIEVVADVVGEAGAQASVDYAAPNHLKLGVYSYATPRHVESLEAFQDLDGTSLNAIALFKEFATDRLARGIAKHLVTGDGSGRPLGLIPSLYNVGAPIIAAAGSEANDGVVTNNGSNSLGSPDFMAAFEALDDAYAASSKAAWLMSKKTLARVSGIVNKFGDQLNLVQYVDGEPFIYGIPVKIAPSMDAIGASNTPVVLGDFRYWVTRLVIDENVGLAVYTEAPGLAENGNVGIRAFARAGGGLAYTDTGSPCPFVVIRNAS